MTPSSRDVLGVLLGALALAGAWRTLEHAREKTDPRRAVVRSIRREAGPRDLLLITDEAPELAAMASPIPAVWGAVAADDLRGVRRVYGIGPNNAALAPLVARFGASAFLDAEHRTARWDVERDHLDHVVFDASRELGRRVTGERVGGAAGGPCPLDGAVLGCRGDEWNRVRVEPHRFDGVELRCIYAHPQADGVLTLHFTGLPAARALAGAVGIDDAGYFPGGATVRAHFTLRPEGLPEIVRDVDALSRRGVAGYRIELPGAESSATVTVTTPNAGARQFCFTFVMTD